MIVLTCRVTYKMRVDLRLSSDDFSAPKQVDIDLNAAVFHIKFACVSRTSPESESFLRK